jgi:hypothetical protein
MISWEDKIIAILSSSSGDLRLLAQLTGENPASFYRFQDLSQCDLRGQDLRGMDLTGTNIECATLDEATKIDPEFDPRFIFKSEYISFNINRNLNLFIAEFAKDANYSYEAWAYKFLIDRAIKIHKAGNWLFYENIIAKNEKFHDLIENKSKSSMLIKTIQVYEQSQEYIYKRIFSEDAEQFSLILAIGALSVKIRYNSKKDFSQISPLILFRKS